MATRASWDIEPLKSSCLFNIASCLLCGKICQDILASQQLARLALIVPRSCFFILSHFLIRHLIFLSLCSLFLLSSLSFLIPSPLSLFYLSFLSTDLSICYAEKSICSREDPMVNSHHLLWHLKNSNRQGINTQETKDTIYTYLSLTAFFLASELYSFYIVRHVVLKNS